MTDAADLEPAARELLTRISGNRAEVMAFCFGFLDQAVKSYLRGDHTRADLERNRAFMELVLDLHSAQKR